MKIAVSYNVIHFNRTMILISHIIKYDINIGIPLERLKCRPAKTVIIKKEQITLNVIAVNTVYLSNTCWFHHCNKTLQQITIVKEITKPKMCMLSPLLLCQIYSL